jgi:hypothetical protein
VAQRTKSAIEGEKKEHSQRIPAETRETVKRRRDPREWKGKERENDPRVTRKREKIKEGEMRRERIDPSHHIIPPLGVSRPGDSELC